MSGQVGGPCGGAAGTNTAQWSGKSCLLKGQGFHPKQISDGSSLTQQLMLDLPDSQNPLSNIKRSSRRSYGTCGGAETVYW